MGVGSLWKWEDAKRVVEDDPRSRALRSMAERKNAFNDYIKELRNKEKIDMKERKVRQREAFNMMLEEMYHAKKLDILSKYYIVSKSITMQGDFRYKACDEKDREELF
jgi:pre-mRNA-processing factor 40